MDFLNGLTDEQLALAGCFAALVVTGLLMSVSYYIGRLGQRGQIGDSQESSVQADSRETRSRVDLEPPSRKAA